MEYVFVVYYSESNYEMPSFVRVFSNKNSAIDFIENHPESTKRFLDWEMVAAEIER